MHEKTTDMQISQYYWNTMRDSWMLFIKSHSSVSAWNRKHAHLGWFNMPKHRPRWCNAFIKTGRLLAEFLWVDIKIWGLLTSNRSPNANSHATASGSTKFTEGTIRNHTCFKKDVIVYKIFLIRMPFKYVVFTKNVLCSYLFGHYE